MRQEADAQIVYLRPSNNRDLSYLFTVLPSKRAPAVYFYINGKQPTLLLDGGYTLYRITEQCLSY